METQYVSEQACSIHRHRRESGLSGNARNALADATSVTFRTANMPRGRMLFHKRASTNPLLARAWPEFVHLCTVTTCLLGAECFVDNVTTKPCHPSSKPQTTISDSTRFTCKHLGRRNRRQEVPRRGTWNYLLLMHRYPTRVPNKCTYSCTRSNPTSRRLLLIAPREGL